MGDVIHAIPAQQQLREEFPDAEIHWLTEPPYRQLLEAVPGIERIWLADTKSWRRSPGRLRELGALRRGLRQERFDLAIDFQGLLKSALLGRLSGAERLVGFRAERFKESTTRWFYHQRIDGEADLSRHVQDTNLRLASLISGANGGRHTVPFEIPAEAFAEIDSRLEKAGITSPVVINPGAGWATKLWPARRYGQLGREIESRLGLPVVYSFGPGEEGLIEQIRNGRDQSRVVAFPTTILELAALCRRSTLFVSGDTGPLHLAASLGVPTVAVLGPTSRKRNGPFDPDDEVVQYDLHCSDCYKRSCDVFICMNLPVFEVLRAVALRLGKADRPAVPVGSPREEGSLVE